MTRRVRESHNLRKETAMYSGDVVADSCVFVARKQQGEETVAGAGLVVLYPLVCAKHLTNKADAL